MAKGLGEGGAFAFLREGGAFDFNLKGVALWRAKPGVRRKAPLKTLWRAARKRPSADPRR
jgi:hypothetical protein